MGRENSAGVGRIFGQALWQIIKAVWKICMMLLWGTLRVTEIIAGQIAQFLKKNVLKINS